MKYALVCGVVLLLACCGSPRETPEANSPRGPKPSETERTKTPTPDATTVSAANEPAAQREIYIDDVKAVNPATVTGRARTFENAVSVRLLDAAGTVIAEEHVTSTGETGHHNPYEARAKGCLCI